MPKFILKINSDDTELIDNGDICCYLADENSAPQIVDAARKSDKLVLSFGENAAADCVEKQFDGALVVHPVDDKYAKFIKPLQKQLGRKFLGLGCEATRHEAMLVSEAEPDFVAFKINRESQNEAAEVLRWYGELFLLQSALFYTPELNDEILSLTDFVILNTAEYKILVDKIKRLD